MASADLRMKPECSVCLSIYTDPLTLMCGHSMCRGCIDHIRDTAKDSGDIFCPGCREEFHRPATQRNGKMHNMVESLVSTHQDEEIIILCTHCLHSPVPAVISCLHCEASLCEDHLKVHSKSPEHILLDPNTSMESRKCSIHKEILKYYCTKDAACICVSCSLAGEHQGHPVQTLDEAFKRKKERLRNELKKLTIDRENTKERIQSLQERQKRIQELAVGETGRVMALFQNLKRQLKNLEKRVLKEITREARCVWISDVIQQLEIKMDELCWKMDHIEELCNTNDRLTFLQDNGDIEEGGDGDREKRDEQVYNGGDLDVSGITQIFHTGLSEIIGWINRGIYIPVPADISLDANTAGNNLYISESRKTASWSDIYLNHPETPERFPCAQVLSSQSFSSGRHYWEVDVGGSDLWMVGMCYPSIDRKGGQSVIGYNNKSWALYRNKEQQSVRHDRKKSPLAASISCNRVRIYLDYDVGQIHVYNLCDPIRHLHTFTSRFTEPLHAALWVGRGCIKISGCGAVRP
ncbi:E3 ubiquitin-protein ligase TRIM21-like [Gastrophryne carolinensis]